MNEKLYILFGTGPDAVGLVQQITTPIAGLGGNLMDLRQDVLHGLFTVFLVVDFAGASASAEEIEGLVAEIAGQTGLDLRVEKYQPVARSGERENLLLILIGRDRPGIIAAVSECLSSYQVNIELSQMIARESIFLMELLVDIGRSTLPLENLQATLRGHMAGLGIETLFQDRDVFNKKKRVLLFDLGGSFMDGATRDEILRQAGIAQEAFRAIYPPGDSRRLPRRGPDPPGGVAGGGRREARACRDADTRHDGADPDPEDHGLPGRRGLRRLHPADRQAARTFGARSLLRD